MNEAEKKTHSTGSQNLDKQQNAELSQSKPISVSLAEHLFALAKSVTKQDVNPQSVRAACECASEIHKLLELQWKIARR